MVCGCRQPSSTSLIVERSVGNGGHNLTQSMNLMLTIDRNSEGDCKNVVDFASTKAARGICDQVWRVWWFMRVTLVRRKGGHAWREVQAVGNFGYTG
mmetsp:Transcript_26660/g.78765  ORF Transcript_26660/g.78765 Transcript_26660/m.78765 type:complete len:97 (+) Transcript_26660:707-997(+)